MNYTNEQLKRTLAKMLPENVLFDEESKNIWFVTNERKRITGMPVLDTELLHLCWLVECGLSRTMTAVAQSQCTEYVRLLENEYGTTGSHFITWQQRTVALAQTLGIEIV